MTNPTMTAIPATFEELNRKLKDTMTIIQKRNSKLNEERQTTKIRQQDDQGNDTHNQKQGQKTSNRRHLEQLLWPQKKHNLHQYQTQESPRNTQARQDLAPTRMTDRASRTFLQTSLRSSTHRRRRHTNTKHPQPTTTHDDTVHDVGTRQRINKLNRDKAADTRGVNAEMIQHSTKDQKLSLPLYHDATKPNEEPPLNNHFQKLNITSNACEQLSRDTDKS